MTIERAAHLGSAFLLRSIVTPLKARQLKNNSSLNLFYKSFILELCSRTNSSLSFPYYLALPC
jgi:hypothetical protein